MEAWDARMQKARVLLAPKEFACPVFCREFEVLPGEKTEIALTALGNFLLFVNGKRVGEEYFLPSNSLYAPRDTQKFAYPLECRFSTYRLYYTVYDLTRWTKEGENRLEIAVGNGWWRQNRRTAEGEVAFGDQLGALFALRFSGNGKERLLYSEGTETCRTDARIQSDLFYGEVLDTRIREFQTAPVSVGSLPETVLSREIAPPDRVMRILTPRLLYREPGRSLYDAGECISGFVTLKTHAAAGEEVRIRFADCRNGQSLSLKGTGPNYKDPNGNPQTMEDRVIGNGSEQEFSPRFLWHAFRYFEIFGEAEPVSISVVHSAVPVAAEFSCSLPELNWLFDAFVRTQQDNMHQGVPSDCPHRERLAYTGDGQVSCEAAMLCLSAKSFYRKWIRDIFDSQDRDTGHIHHTAPFGGGGGGPGGWGMAAITVPYYYWKITGDFSPIREHYPGILFWIDYLKSRSENGLVVREEPGGWCLGDWSSPEKMQLDPSFVNTCLMIRALRFAVQMAEKMNDSVGKAAMEKQIAESSAAVKKRFLNEETGSFAGTAQGADAFALQAGLGDERTRSCLADTYAHLKKFDTGFLATDLLVRQLGEDARIDLLTDLLTGHKIGGFGAMMDAGATTIWENWQGSNSQNHPMFGGCTQALFSVILGIRQPKDSFGFDRVEIAPQMPEKMQYARGSLTTPHGRLSVDCEKKPEGVQITLEIPEGMSADLYWQGQAFPLTAGRNIRIFSPESRYGEKI